MEFFIKKGATLPLLKLNIVDNGRNDYNNFLNTLELSAVFFSMTNEENGVPKIVNRPGGVGYYNSPIISGSPQYYIYYQFSESDTKKEGRFEGEFILRNDDGTFVLPLNDKLIINISDSFIVDDLEYSSCFVIDYACCSNGSPITIISPTPTPTSTVTPTPTPTITISNSPSVTPTETLTPTPTITISNSPSVTPTQTLTPTPTPSTVTSTEVILSYDATDCGVACNGYYTGPTSSYYTSTSTPLTTGDVLYTNSSLTILANLGFYSDGTFCYEFCNNSGTIEICSILSCG